MTYGPMGDPRNIYTGERMTKHTVRLDPPVRFDCCDECRKLAHIRPYSDQLVCDGCRQDMILEDCWNNYPDDAA